MMQPFCTKGKTPFKSYENVFPPLICDSNETEHLSHFQCQNCEKVPRETQNNTGMLSLVGTISQAMPAGSPHERELFPTKICLNPTPCQAPSVQFQSHTMTESTTH